MTWGFGLAAAAGAFLALTPIGMPAPRRPDIQALAEVAHAMVPVGGVIVFGGDNYFAVANQFVFYSDRLLQPGKGEPNLVRDGLDRGRWALVDRAHYEHLTGKARFSLADTRYPLVASAGNWALLHRAPATPVDFGAP